MRHSLWTLLGTCNRIGIEAAKKNVTRALQHLLADTELVVGRHPDPWVVWQDVGLLQVGKGEMAAPERLPYKRGSQSG